MKQPEVSVVIPTIGNNLSFLSEAIDSVASQSVSPSEIIVVFDGSSESFEAELRQLSHHQYKVLFTGERSNANVARNLGAQHSQGDFIAFLDDDDVWAPKKLQTQIDTFAELAKSSRVLLTAGVQLFGAADDRWPSRIPSKGEDVADYIFRRSSLATKTNFLQTSTWLMSRRLFESCNFDNNLPIHQDLDFLLRASELEDFQLLHIDEPLVKYRVTTTPSTSRSGKYEDSYGWLESIKSKIGARNFGDAVLTFPFSMAVKQGDINLAKLYKDLASKHGKPGLPARIVSFIKLSRVRLGLTLNR